MPWKETCVMDQRKLFIIRAEQGEESFTELCEEFEISRKTGYKWVRRFREEGFSGLEEMSRRPHKFREQVENEIICEIFRIRHWKSTWGGRKIRNYMKSQGGVEQLPHARTIDRYLKRGGFVTPKRTGWRGKWNGEELIEPQEANDVWTTDFKGWWRTRDGSRCEPLTVRDAATRFLLNLSAHEGPSFAVVKERFTELFTEYGMPLAIRMDNGSPFASVHGLHRLTRFGVWLLKLGIIPNRIMPASPYMNGAHERIHLDVKRELQRNPAADNKSEQERFDAWRFDFNHVRPHDALHGKCPGDLYAKSPRSFLGKTIEFEYPPDFERRKVTHGLFHWQNKQIRLAKVFAGEYIGIEQVAEPVPRVWFNDFCLGVISDGKFVAAQALEKHPIGRRVTY